MYHFTSFGHVHAILISSRRPISNMPVLIPILLYSSVFLTLSCMICSIFASNPSQRPGFWTFHILHQSPIAVHHTYRHFIYHGFLKSYFLRNLQFLYITISVANSVMGKVPKCLQKKPHFQVKIPRLKKLFSKQEPGMGICTAPCFHMIVIHTIYTRECAYGCRHLTTVFWCWP